ncbi:MAG: hypothetical protein HZB99_04025 [Candidatus Harrisonbacteria bacterium]|nr:hypothetical protein [Candidatus Harrisonbacteria bacterium]
MRARTQGQYCIDLALGAFLEMLELDLLECCDLETTSCMEHWSEDNPAYGHCAVIALIVQDFLGGNLLRASLESFPKYAHMRSHYWNLLPGNGELAEDVHKNFILRRTGRRDQTKLIDIEVDLSVSQFEPGIRRIVPEGEVRTREYVLSNPDTARRYEWLKNRLIAKNPEFYKED